jgi:uncharacterized membrane protein YfcA
MDEMWWTYFLVGMAAQLVDGALGMAFGVTATSLMLSFGTAPATASAITHIAEVFTTGASGASHYFNRNIDWTLVRRLAIPGVIGGIIGATILSHIDGKTIAPFVAGYLVIMGLVILVRALRGASTGTADGRGMSVTGFAGGLLDAIGGGGWGPIVTSTLIGRGHPPRQVIGSANLTEFLVTVTISATFIVTLGWTEMRTALGLLVGGVLAAPLGGWLVKRLPTRMLMIAVGLLVIATSLYRLLR